MNPNIEFSIKTAQAYNAVCKPLCQELGLSQTALDILLFLANNPDYKTARDIVEVRHIKANLVSMNVDKLVQEGYLRREKSGRGYSLFLDRRAEAILPSIRQLLDDWWGVILEGLSQEEREQLTAQLSKMAHRALALTEGEEE